MTSMSNQSSRLIVGCGYLGNRVAEHWRQQGRSVAAVTRSADRAAQFRQAGLIPVVLDLSTDFSRVSIPAADVVLWSVGFDRAAGVPREKVWLDGLRTLIRSLPTAPQRFIYVSSTSVYGTGDGGTVDEQTAPNPVTDGGRCCVQAEQLMRETLQQAFPETQAVVLRMAGIYGPGRLLRRISDLRSRTPLPGNGDSLLNLIHVDDAVRMVDFAATADLLSDLFNVVNTGTLTRNQYYSSLADLVEAPPPVFTETVPVGGMRGGNKRVTSAFSDPAEPLFRYNDVLAGIRNAVENSQIDTEDR